MTTTHVPGASRRRSMGVSPVARRRARQACGFPRGSRCSRAAITHGACLLIVDALHVKLHRFQGFDFSSDER